MTLKKTKITYKGKKDPMYHLAVCRIFSSNGFGICDEV